MHLRLALTGVLSISGMAWGVGYEKTFPFSAKQIGLAGAAMSNVNGPDSLYSVNEAPVLAANTPLKSKRGFLPIGAIMASYEAMENLTLGVGAYVMGGLAVDYGDVTIAPGYAKSQKASLTDIEFAYGVAYKVTPEFNLGATWRISLVSSNVAMIAPDGVGGANHIRFVDLSDKHFAGFSFGGQYRPTGGSWGLGAFLRTPVSFTAAGTATLENSAAPGTVNAIGAASLTSTLPVLFGFAGDFVVAENIKLYAQYDWTNYKKNKAIAIVNTTLNGAGLSELAQAWNDKHSIRLGFEYLGVEGWPLRMGYALQSAVTNSANASSIYTAPGEAHALAFGTGSKFLEDKLSIDLAFDFGWVNATATAPLAGTYKTSAIGGHMSGTYTF
jgi:long-subunit fatty acid transport protein